MNATVIYSRVREAAHFPYGPIKLMSLASCFIAVILFPVNLFVNDGKRSGVDAIALVKPDPANPSPAMPAYLMNFLLLFFI